MVCRQLRLGASGRAAKLHYENGSQSILLSNVVCSSTDHTIAACAHSGVRIAYDVDCNHDFNAGVICYSMLHSIMCSSCTFCVST